MRAQQAPSSRSAWLRAAARSAQAEARGLAAQGLLVGDIGRVHGPIVRKIVPNAALLWRRCM
jgi:hypothetical protein